MAKKRVARVFRPPRFEPFDELVRAGDDGAPADEHAVHVDEIALRRSLTAPRRQSSAGGTGAWAWLPVS